MINNNTKELIIKRIKERVGNITNDCYTFCLARLRQNEFKEVGGGNLSMGLLLFSCINYLAKVYSLLEGHTRPISSEVELRGKEYLDGHVELKKYTSGKTSW